MLQLVRMYMACNTVCDGKNIFTYDNIKQSYNTNIFSDFKDMINQHSQQNIHSSMCQTAN